jgi:hypothetical protein
MFAWFQRSTHLRSCWADWLVFCADLLVVFPSQAVADASEAASKRQTKAPRVIPSETTAVSSRSAYAFRRACIALLLERLVSVG